MKVHIFIVSIILFTACISSRNYKKELAPPGTIKLKENLYIDRTEVGNVHYKEFLAYLSQVIKDTFSFEQNKLDTTVWSREVCYSSPYVIYYHRHPSYNYYPVVGVSFENAIAFCKFRTEAVNKSWDMLNVHPFPKKKVVYRLPTEEEWELAAISGFNVDSFPFGFKDTLYNGRVNFNTKQRIYNNCVEPNNLREISSYAPNTNGFCNMIGNVSEMIDKKGIAKGGNFMLPLDSCKIKNRQFYTQTEIWVGFRCVAELVDK